MPAIARAAATALLLSMLPSAVSADDVWTDPYPGVRHLHRTTTDPYREIYMLVIDLEAPGIAFTVNRHADRNVSTPTFARQHGVDVAINAGLCGEGGDVCRSLQIGRGEAWPDSVDNDINGNLAFGLDRLELIAAEEIVAPEPWMFGLVSSKPTLVHEGVVREEFPPEWDICAAGVRHPRTAVGLSEDRRTLWLVVIDGRTGPVGMTCPVLARFMHELGAHWALNLDGGGSSTMWIDGVGVVNTPSDGTPRTVANHLGVFALGEDFAAELVGLDAPATLAEGEVGTVTITYRNTGTSAWVPEQVGLRTTMERDHASVLATETWRTPSRPGGLTTEVAPGATAEMRFEVRGAAPAGGSCTMVEHFGLLLEGYGPFADVSTWFGPEDEAARVEIALAGCGAPAAVDAGPGSVDAGAAATPAVLPPATSMSGGCSVSFGRAPILPAALLLPWLVAVARTRQGRRARQP